MFNISIDMRRNILLLVLVAFAGLNIPFAGIDSITKSLHEMVIWGPISVGVIASALALLLAYWTVKREI